jgi:hypothetical protein
VAPLKDRLREDEQEIWQAHWNYNAPLTERMSRIGYPRETVGALQKP